eukprot:CAMPEP_0182447040 /NCGR_PEP_ID=MMETSP1172-20130603/10630_1 /TAXON_ID=708627 /ORGANISM="Timspurckia oligopyrenoides, Strain CCMP3278" /LENGTH=237 /DNA_ID=CAMNT_0024643305 /DNA_START=90 /DNA_END=800 /DNA_ORIENTATION=-
MAVVGFKSFLRFRSLGRSNAAKQYQNKKLNHISGIYSCNPFHFSVLRSSHFATHKTTVKQDQIWHSGSNKKQCKSLGLHTFNNSAFQFQKYLSSTTDSTNDESSESIAKGNSDDSIGTSDDDKMCEDLKTFDDFDFDDWVESAPEIDQCLLMSRIRMVEDCQMSPKMDLVETLVTRCYGPPPLPKNRRAAVKLEKMVVDSLLELSQQKPLPKRVEKEFVDQLQEVLKKKGVNESRRW